MKNIATDYEKDFHAWTLENAALLRQRRFAEIDVDNIAEELENMGRSERHELVNRLAVLLAHLLKWRFQPARRSAHLRRRALPGVYHSGGPEGLPSAGR